MGKDCHYCQRQDIRILLNCLFLVNDFLPPWVVQVVVTAVYSGFEIEECSAGTRHCHTKLEKKTVHDGKQISNTILHCGDCSFDLQHQGEIFF